MLLLMVLLSGRCACPPIVYNYYSGYRIPTSLVLPLQCQAVSFRACASLQIIASQRDLCLVMLLVHQTAYTMTGVLRETSKHN